MLRALCIAPVDARIVVNHRQGHQWNAVAIVRLVRQKQLYLNRVSRQSTKRQGMTGAWGQRMVQRDTNMNVLYMSSADGKQERTSEQKAHGLLCLTIPALRAPYTTTQWGSVRKTLGEREGARELLKAIANQ